MASQHYWNRSHNWMNRNPQAIHDHALVTEMGQVFVVIITAYIPFIVFNNVLVILSICVNKKLRETPINLLFLSLAIADLSMGLYCIPMFLLANLKATQKTILTNKYLCLSWFASSYVAAGGSLNNLLIISIDRFVEIMFPHSYYRYVTVKRMKRFVVCLWIYIFVIAYLPMTGITYFKEKGCDYYRTLPIEYILWAVFVTISVCIVVPVLLYVNILIMLCKQIKKQRHTVVLSKEHRDQFQSRKISVKMSLARSLVFVALWIPYLITITLKHFKYNSKYELPMMTIGRILYFFNAVVNAPIYVSLAHDYKMTIWYLFSNFPWKWNSEDATHYCAVESVQTRDRSSVEEESPETPDLTHQRPSFLVSSRLEPRSATIVNSVLSQDRRASTSV